MYCHKCAAEITDESRFCKICGTPTGAPANPSPNTYPYTYPYPYPYQTPMKQTNNMALVGLILAFVMPIAGLIVSIVARRQCIERGEDGEQMAKAGIIVSAVYCGLAAVILIAAMAIPLVMLMPMFNQALSGMM